MRKSRFSEAQIIKILKAIEAGKPVKDACREHGISDATLDAWPSSARSERPDFYNWRS